MPKLEGGNRDMKEGLEVKAGRIRDKHGNPVGPPEELTSDDLLEGITEEDLQSGETGFGRALAGMEGERKTFSRNLSPVEKEIQDSRKPSTGSKTTGYAKFVESQESEDLEVEDPSDKELSGIFDDEVTRAGDETFQSEEEKTLEQIPPEDRSTRVREERAPVSVDISQIQSQRSEGDLSIRIEAGIRVITAENSELLEPGWEEDPDFVKVVAEMVSKRCNVDKNSVVRYLSGR